MSDPDGRRAQRIALVGPIQQESLPLQYLIGAARRAGHEATLVGYNYRSELDAAVRETLALDPDIVGVSIAFQNSIGDYVDFVNTLRARGYEGHVTCGGHVPTFCYAELMRDVPGLDTVVRHDGEDALVEILDRLARGEPVADIPGLVWRAGEEIELGPPRAPVTDLDTIAWPGRSEETYSVGGVTVDFVIAARGCVGACNYCSIAAYTAEQQKRYRLRRPESVADEIAMLHHDRHVRVIFIQDDLFVLPREAATIERVRRLTEALERHGVRDLVFWAKGRPQSMTPSVCQALREMGVIHLFLGVESGSRSRLRYLGRTHQPEDNHTAIANCREAGIVPSFNFMLFDPDTSLEDVEVTLDLAETHIELPWNVCRTEVYSGTSLRARLEREGRLQGDYRSYGYQMRDAQSELLFRILRVSLREHALEIESLLNRLIGLSFARQLHEHYFPGQSTDALSKLVIDLCTDARRDTTRVIREAIAFVRSHDLRDEAAVRDYAISSAFALNARDHERNRLTRELWQHLTLRGASLFERRGVPVPSRVWGGWGAAAGS